MISEQETQTSARYYREHTGGHDEWYQVGWWTWNKSAGDGYATPEKARAEPDPDSGSDASRIVEVVTTITTTVVE